MVRGRLTAGAPRILAVVFSVVLAGCATRVPPAIENPLRIVPRAAWPELVDDLDREGLVAAMEHSLSYFDALPEDLVTVDLEAFGLSRQARAIVGRVEEHELVPYVDRSEIDFGRGLPAPAPVLGYLADPVDVFFRPLEAEDGPLGCYGVPVTAGRSIATDRRLFPAPVVAWIEGTMPGPNGEQRRFSRFAFNQDTGGSIRGPGRVDLFIGAGDEAAEIAGRMNNPGRFYLLLPSSI